MRWEIVRKSKVLNMTHVIIIVRILLLRAFPTSTFLRCWIELISLHMCGTQDMPLIGFFSMTLIVPLFSMKPFKRNKILPDNHILIFLLQKVGYSCWISYKRNFDIVWVVMLGFLVAPLNKRNEFLPAIWTNTFWRTSISLRISISFIFINGRNSHLE